jgi:type IX secretion system PorP/SprF family membrane protein
MIRFLLLLSLFTFIIQFSIAQDIHFSQYELSPLTLNPAKIGAFEGTFRVGGIYRDQWSQVINNPFRTPSAYIDAPIIRGFRAQDWVGVGAYIYNDKRGSAGLSNMAMMGGAAYHLGLGNTYISLGVQAGRMQESIDRAALIFEDQIEGGVITGNPSQDFPRVPENAGYMDFNAGLGVNSRITDKISINAGFALHHLLAPERNFLTGSTQTLERRVVLHGGSDIDVAENITVYPSLMYQTMAGMSSFNAQAMAGYHLSPERDITVKAGLGFRSSDALIPMIGVDYKNFRFGAAYDLNTFGIATANVGQGGFELALSYIAKIYRTPVVKPVLFCPRF